MRQTSKRPVEHPVPELIAQRYRRLGELGGGGMAHVYAVLDTATGKKVALKRPTKQPSIEHQRRVEELFAREFHAMCQLSHPRIVEVYDYGVDGLGPYYTMEILDGGDLQQLVPLERVRLCQIARDVCSALSLLHSRRIVHRDLSPRNVRCTTSGVAKLIDFGAMTPMGPSKELVGTPAYCAPEVLNMQALDARTDLYALGATMYYALTGHHPYPARDFASLQGAWRFGLARPSELVPEIPEALDALVLDLLQLDPNLRPSNAAEVLERLSAIEGRAVNDQSHEQLVVAQSYLASPSFVGRATELGRVQARTRRALRKHGAVMLVKGARGAGRTRFLDACLLDAKLQGCTGLRADADDAAQGDYGLLKRLLLQLQQLQPELARTLITPELPVLGHVMPELLGADAPPLQQLEPASLLRGAIQASMQCLLLAAAERTPLFIAIDDLERGDEPSVAALALLSRELEGNRLVLLATTTAAEPDERSAAFRMLSATANRLTLPGLTPEQSAELLGSIFGTSQSLAALTQRLHSLSAGSPRDLMRLAQHLVDRGLARYASGTWSLPAELNESDLPESVAQLMQERIESLGAEAKQLAAALAFSPELTFSFDEARKLGAQGGQDRVLRDVDSLIAADIVRIREGCLMLKDRAWIAPLTSQLPPALARSLHLRLADVFERRGDDTFRHAKELLHGGDAQRALDVFTRHAIESRKATDASPQAFQRLLASLPDDWYQTYELALLACDELGRPQRDRQAILARLSGIVAIKSINDRVHLPEWVYGLKEASGLGEYERLDPQLPPGARLGRALQLAGERYAQLPEHERFADPKEAIQLLSMAVRFVPPAAAPALDLVLMRSLPSLQPLVALAPALGIAERLRLGVEARLSGRLNVAMRAYTELLEHLSAADSGGLAPTHARYALLMVDNGLALLEAGMGLSTCLQRAERISSDPLLRPSAATIRMLHAFWQGDNQTAERERRQGEELRLQSGAATADQGHLVWQLLAHAGMDDLTRLKHTLLEIAPLAARYEGWRHVETFGQAEYERVRGDAKAASALLTPLLEMLRAGEHQLWSPMAAAQVRALDAAGQSVRAVEEGQRFLNEAHAAELGPWAESTIAAPLEVARARQGDTQAPLGVEAAITLATEAGASGLALGALYEARAYIALFQRDEARFVQCVERCEQEFTRRNNPALAAKLQRLKREGQRRNFGPAQLQPHPTTGQAGLTMLKSRLGKLGRADERAKAMLVMLAQRSGATQAFLYQLGVDGPRCVATVGEPELDPMLDAMVEELIAAETQEREQTTGGDESILQTQWTALGESKYRRIVLSHYNASGCCVTGVAVFVVKPGQAFVHPGEAASQASQMAYELGDATAIIVEDD